LVTIRALTGLALASLLFQWRLSKLFPATTSISLSVATQRARRSGRALFLHLNADLSQPIYPTVAGTGSSTLASRRNFAASSGGVGLM